MTALVRGWGIGFPQVEFIVRSQLSRDLTLAAKAFVDLARLTARLKSCPSRSLQVFGFLAPAARPSEGRGWGCGGRGRVGEICGRGEEGTRRWLESLDAAGFRAAQKCCVALRAGPAPGS